MGRCASVFAATLNHGRMFILNKPLSSKWRAIEHIVLPKLNRNTIKRLRTLFQAWADAHLASLQPWTMVECLFKINCCHPNDVQLQTIWHAKLIDKSSLIHVIKPIRVSLFSQLTCRNWQLFLFQHGSGNNACFGVRYMGYNVGETGYNCNKNKKGVKYFLVVLKNEGN